MFQIRNRCLVHFAKKADFEETHLCFNEGLWKAHCSQQQRDRFCRMWHCVSNNLVWKKLQEVDLFQRIRIIKMSQWNKCLFLWCELKMHYYQTAKICWFYINIWKIDPVLQTPPRNYTVHYINMPRRHTQKYIIACQIYRFDISNLKSSVILRL